MNRKTRNAWFLARALSRVPSGHLRSPEPEGGGGGGTAPPPEKTFTQADLDRIVGQRLGEATKKFSDYEDVKSKAAKAAEYETELAKLREEKEMAGKSAEERERISAKKAADAMERERQELMTKIQAAEQRAENESKLRRNLIVNNGLGSALDGANVLTSAREDAIETFRNRSQVEIDDEGKIVSVTYGGVAYKSAAEAAVAFLKEKDHFASARVRGPGGSSPVPGSILGTHDGGNGGGAQNATAEGLLSQGFQQRSRK
jgi:hypothetical protein